jgi:hypothetical protein
MITYFNNNFNEKYWAIFGPKLSRTLGDLNDQGTNVPLLQIPNLSHQNSDQVIGKPDYGHGVCLLKHFVFEPPEMTLRPIRFYSILLMQDFIMLGHLRWRRHILSLLNSECLINICCVPFNFI